MSPTRSGEFGQNIETLGPIHWAGVGLAGITGAIHLYLFVVDGYEPFLPAGLGFFGAIILLMYTSGWYRQLIYLVGIPFTGAQIVLFYLLTFESIGALEPIEIVDKAVQALLIVLLVYLLYVEYGDGPD